MHIECDSMLETTVDSMGVDSMEDVRVVSMVAFAEIKITHIHFLSLYSGKER